MKQDASDKDKDLEALEEIITIEIPAGVYVINGHQKQVNYKFLIDRRAALTAPKVDDEPCALCGELTNSLSGDPAKWPLSFPHPDGTGFTRHHHVGCVTERLFAPKVDVESLKEERTKVKTNIPQSDLPAWFLGWNACVDHLAARGYLSQPKIGVLQTRLDDAYRQIDAMNNAAIKQSLAEENYFAMCAQNGYTPFENDIQDWISSLVSPEIAKTISTRISSSLKCTPIATSQPKVEPIDTLEELTTAVGVFAEQADWPEELCKAYNKARAYLELTKGGER